MNKLIFEPDAFREYVEWQAENRKIKKINGLIKDIQRNGMLQGIGKPEPLKHITFQGKQTYSRHIDDANRLIYATDESQNLYIITCKGHYS